MPQLRPVWNSGQLLSRTYRIIAQRSGLDSSHESLECVEWPDGQGKGAGTVSPTIGRQAHNQDSALPPAQATQRLIDRRDLVAGLDRAAAKKVTIISAPAGSGKTSLIRAWADRPAQPYRLALVQVQRDQRDGQSFWLAVLNAARRGRGTGKRMLTAVATPDFNGAVMVDRVRSELAYPRAPVMLIVDDLHELNSPEVVAQFARLLTELPPKVHAMLAMRRDVRLHLHQLRLAGELAELRAADLRFTEWETRELLDASGIALSESDAALLHQRTEGWAAGLRLAVLALEGHADPERFVAEFSGSDRTVADYLIAEMLERQPTGVQDLLLRTSVVDRFNGELADRLTGRVGSERILLDLEDANAFVVSLDPERTWFRYHHLFGELLRLELRRTLPEVVPALHQQAAKWFLAHGQVVDAIRHTQAVGNWSSAARLLADHSLSLMFGGQAQTVQGLLRAFPRGTEADQTDLALVRAMGEVVQGRMDEAAAHLTLAESHVEATPSVRQRHLRLSIASMRLSLTRRRGHLPDAIEHAATFLATPFSAWSEEDIAFEGDLRAVALFNLGILEAWSQALPDGEGHLREGADLARRIGRPYLEVGCLAELGFASKIRSIADARRRSDQAIALAERYGWGREWIVAPALVTLAETLVWMGQFDEAEHWLQRTTEVLQADTGPGIRQLLHRATGMLYCGRGHHREALEEFRAAVRLQSRLAGTDALASQVTGWTLCTQVRLGMPREARRCLAALPDAAANSPEVRNSLAVISLAEGNPNGALGVVQDVLDDKPGVAHRFTLVGTHLLGALAHRELGDQRAANRTVERALALAETDRLVLPFAMTATRDLLEALPAHETAHAALVTDIIDVLDGASPTVSARPSVPPIQPLSQSELRVLRYLPTNLSRPEIARELSVSVNTVNTHVRNIYAKFQAGDHSSAVQRARDLRLLAPSLSRYPSGSPHHGEDRSPAWLQR